MDQRNAINSISAYVERADFVVIVAPGCLHADRRDPETNLRTKTCYRTYRGRGWCVLEVFAAYLSRDKQFPSLLINSKEGTPEWLSAMDTLNLAVGTSDYTCCQRNHVINSKVVSCDRDVTLDISRKMIHAKSTHFFQLGHMTRARMCACFENWWLRTSSIPDESRNSSIASFQQSLCWDDCDGVWADREGVPLLFYAVLRNDVGIVRELLKRDICTIERLNEFFFKNGLVEFGIPAKVSILHIAMGFASVEIVKMVLRSGAHHEAKNITDVDSLMVSSMNGRVENIKFWLFQFPAWNVNRRTKFFGSTALHCAVIIGRNKLNTVQALVESKRASLDALSYGGTSVLSGSVSTHDSDVNVVRYLLSQKLAYGVNWRRKSQTTKWKLIYGFARGIFRARLFKSELFAQLSMVAGSTPLQWAVYRGDVEIVEVLMEHGADPSIKNDLGRDVLSYSGSFPEISSEILRVLREKGRDQGRSMVTKVQTKKSVTDFFTLQRRISTAVPVRYDMHLLSLGSMLSLFGQEDEAKRNKYLCHQDLLKREELIRFEDLPLGAFVMFISHQWTGFNHPDPSGRQMQVLSKILRDLRDGHHTTETEPFHVLAYKMKNIVTDTCEWSALLSNGYIWFDWFSQPQPSRGATQSEVDKLSYDLSLALDSVAA